MTSKKYSFIDFASNGTLTAQLHQSEYEKEQDDWPFRIENVKVIDQSLHDFLDERGKGCLVVIQKKNGEYTAIYAES